MAEIEENDKMVVDTSDSVVTPRPRLDYIDGLRAFAACWVVLHHTIEVAIPQHLMEVPVLGWLTRSLFFGQVSVMVFLMLSGFCLYYPCVRRNAGAPRLTSTNREFFERRWRRIAPPFLWAAVFSLTIVAIPAFQGGQWLPLRQLDWRVYVSHLFFVHNLFPDLATKIDYPMWSIGLEFQLYLLFPLAVWAVVKFGWPSVLALSVGIAVAIHAVYGRIPAPMSSILRDGPLAYVEVFALGMLAAVLTVRRRPILPAFAWAAVVVVGFATVRFGSGNGLVHDLATSAATFGILMICVNSTGLLTRTLALPAIVKVGIFSYSLYLIHAPVLHMLDVPLDRLGVGPDMQFFLLVLIGFPIILGVSYAFHCAFERPGMRARKPTVAATATPRQLPT